MDPLICIHLILHIEDHIMWYMIPEDNAKRLECQQRIDHLTETRQIIIDVSSRIDVLLIFSSHVIHSIAKKKKKTKIRSSRRDVD